MPHFGRAVGQAALSRLFGCQGDHASGGRGNREALWPELRLWACWATLLSTTLTELEKHSGASLDSGHAGRYATGTKRAAGAACPTLGERWGRLPSAARLVAKWITAQDAGEQGSTRARASTLGMSGRYATGTKRAAEAACPILSQRWGRLPSAARLVVGGNDTG